MRKMRESARIFTYRLIHATGRLVVVIGASVDVQLAHVSADVPCGDVRTGNIHHAPGQGVALEGKGAVGVFRLAEPRLERPLRFVGWILYFHVQRWTTTARVVHELPVLDLKLTSGVR